MPQVVEYKESLQYDGTNGTYICGTWADVDLISEDANGLMIGGNDGDRQFITTGMWVVKNQSFPSYVMIYTNQRYLELFREIA